MPLDGDMSSLTILPKLPILPLFRRERVAYGQVRDVTRHLGQGILAVCVENDDDRRAILSPSRIDLDTSSRSFTGARHGGRLHCRSRKQGELSRICRYNRHIIPLGSFRNSDGR